MLREVLLTICNHYEEATKEKLGNHWLADYIRHEAVNQVENALGDLKKGFKVVGSPEKGNWSTVPWLAIFYPLVTMSAERGYYVVYLFDIKKQIVILSLNQGTTAVWEEFNKEALSILKDRASIMKARLYEFSEKFDLQNFSLNSKKMLLRGYEAGHAFGKAYRISDLPDDKKLRFDLQELCRSYLALDFRGGLDPSIDVHELEEIDGLPSETVTEIRRSKKHLRIERKSKNVKLAKGYHGVRCQVCLLDFSELYGRIGEGFIEAHHLKPLSKLKEDVIENYNVATDFAVLCPNCHRMIHKLQDPSDLQALRNSLRLQK